MAKKKNSTTVGTANDATTQETPIMDAISASHDSQVEDSNIAVPTTVKTSTGKDSLENAVHVEPRSDGFYAVKVYNPLRKYYHGDVRVLQEENGPFETHDQALAAAQVMRANDPAAELRND